MIDFKRLSFFVQLYQKAGDEMHEFVRRLTACGMRVDVAYALCNDYLDRLDFSGLDDFVRGYEIAHQIVNECVD